MNTMGQHRWWVNIDLGNGLVPSDDVDIILCRHMASGGYNELMSLIWGKVTYLLLEFVNDISVTKWYQNVFQYLYRKMWQRRLLLIRHPKLKYQREMQCHPGKSLDQIYVFWSILESENVVKGTLRIVVNIASADGLEFSGTMTSASIAVTKQLDTGGALHIYTYTSIYTGIYS